MLLLLGSLKSRPHRHVSEISQELLCAFYLAASSKKAVKETREDAGKNETEHEKALCQLLDELKPGLDVRKTYCITSFTERYSEILDEKGIASEVYQSKHLKDQ